MPRCSKCDEFLSADDLYCPECGERQRRSLPDFDDDDYVRNSYCASSGLATASFIVAVIGAFLWVVAFGLWFYVRQQFGVPRVRGLMIIVGLSAIIAVILHAVGVGLGIAGTLKQSRNRWMAIVGLIISALGLMAFVVLLLIALMKE
jgi:hypothetical protein